jgi:uncharacterized protein (TIGR00730 family)
MGRNAKIDEKVITEIISDLFNGNSNHTAEVDLLKEIVITTIKLSQDQADRGDLKILHNTLKEMRYAFKLFTPYRHFRKVSIFGSARTLPEDPAYAQAEEFARRITQKGFMVITGAGEGIMRGAQAGAGRNQSFGMNINLPFEQTANQFIVNDPKLMTFKYFFTRKLFFIKEADAVVLFPGGFGTHDEGFEALTLIQTGKSDPIPVIFLDTPGGTYWKAWESYVEHEILRRNLISREDLSLFKVTDNVGTAVDEIARYYANYHSLRYVRDQLVIRTKRAAEPGMLERLNREFQDILVSGTITAAAALPEEVNEPEIQDLPRLILNFNRRNFGRLRQLIDVINLY